MVTYQTSARENVQVQGIDVTLSTSFDDGKLPAKVAAVGGGYINTENGGFNMNFNANYDVAMGLFEYWNGSNIPTNFQDEVQEAIQNFINQIKTDKE